MTFFFLVTLVTDDKIKEVVTLEHVTVTVCIDYRLREKKNSVSSEHVVSFFLTVKYKFSVCNGSALNDQDRSQAPHTKNNSDVIKLGREV